MDPQAAKEVLKYHHRSKHSYQGYARSPGYMDWENQPIPFRFYRGETPINLPLFNEIIHQLARRLRTDESV